MLQLADNKMSKFRLRFLCAAVFAIGSIVGAEAQSLVVNGYFDCQRATNGRTYCKRQGVPTASQWTPVGEDFFVKYEAARTGMVPAPTPPTDRVRFRRAGPCNTSENIFVRRISPAISLSDGVAAVKWCGKC